MMGCDSRKADVGRLRAEFEWPSNIVKLTIAKATHMIAMKAKQTATHQKKKTNEGVASVANSRTTHHSHTSQGTQAREEKRKSHADEDASKKTK